MSRERQDSIPESLQVSSTERLARLFNETSFATDGEFKWSSMHIDNDLHIFVPQCSTLGETLICMNDTYEQHGVDALLIQELLRLCSQGKLQVIQ